MKAPALLAFAGLASLSACMHLPPKSAGPALPMRAPLDGVQLGVRANGTWPDRQWWKRYGDPTLDDLVEISGASATSLNIARARFDVARQSVRQAAAAVGASVSLDADISRQRLSDNGLFPPQLLGFNWYNQADLGLQMGYTFDWWGKQRFVVESALDTAHAAEAERSASELALISAIADSYFGWQQDQARLEISTTRIADARRTRAIAAARVRAQIDSPDALNRARSELGAAREQAAVLEGSAHLRLVLIAALIGRPQAALPQFTARPLPVVSVEIPDDVGIDLLARRADISASRWRVEAARKSIAAARAEYYPDVSIKALAGLSSVQVSHLLEIGSGVPSATAALHLPLFDMGGISARYGTRQAELKSAIADYDDTVVNATKELATQVSTRRQLLAQREQRALEVAAAERIHAAAQARSREGLTDLQPQLDADRNLLAQRDALLQLDGALLSADIALQRALGGGYLSPPDHPPKSPTVSNVPTTPKEP